MSRIPVLPGRRALLGAALLAGCARAAEPVAAATSAQPLSWQGEPAQGALLIGRAASGTRLSLDRRQVSVAPDGRFALGFGRDAAAEAVLHVREPGRPPEDRAIAVAKRQWQEQHLHGLPGNMVTPNAAELARIREEQRQLNAVRAADTPETWFADGFEWPARGRISGVYGSRRILNGEPRAPHLGLDVAVPVGTPVQAAATGRVAMSQELYFTGNTIILDHGHGVMTLHAHLSRPDVSVGQVVPQGETIGLSGRTGRVTGPHLHFAVYWFSTAVDPRPLLPD